MTRDGRRYCYLVDEAWAADGHPGFAAVGAHLLETEWKGTRGHWEVVNLATGETVATASGVYQGKGRVQNGRLVEGPDGWLSTVAS